MRLVGLGTGGRRWDGRDERDAAADLAWRTVVGYAWSCRLKRLAVARAGERWSSPKGGLGGLGLKSLVIPLNVCLSQLSDLTRFVGDSKLDRSVSEERPRF